MAERDPYEPYTIDEIGNFLLTEEVALHGTMPYIHRENTALMSELGRVGAVAQTDILSVSVMGSRAHGYSRPYSDLDLCVLRRASAPTNEHTKLRDLGATLASVEIDAFGATGVYDIKDRVPDDPATFIEWIRMFPHTAAALHHEGIYDTADRRLLGLAALAVRYRDAWAHSDSVLPWPDLRKTYNEAFLGEHLRIGSRLYRRLSLTQTEVYSVITRELVQERYDRFGLPAAFSDIYDPEMAWFEANRDQLEENSGHALYTGVQRLLKRGR